MFEAIDRFVAKYVTLDEDDLAFIWEFHEHEKDCDPSSHMRTHLDNFAKSNGLEVRYSSYVHAAIFRNLI